MSIEEKEILLAAAQQIEQELELDLKLMTAEDAVHLLRERLASTIEYLIDQNFAQLLNRLYIMDIAEKKIVELLKGHSEIAPKYAIADLIIERMVQKVHTRIQYRKEMGLSDEDIIW